MITTPKDPVWIKVSVDVVTWCSKKRFWFFGSESSSVDDGGLRNSNFAWFFFIFLQILEVEVNGD